MKSNDEIRNQQGRETKKETKKDKLIASQEEI